MDLKIRLQVTNYKLLLFIVAVFLTTVARISLLIFAPFIILYLIDQLKLSLRNSIIIIFSTLVLSYLISLFNGFYFRYNLLSFYYVLPFILFLFSKPKQSAGLIKEDLFAVFFKYLSFWAIINNIIGIIQYVNIPGDDSFEGIYGQFTVTQNALSLLNFILFYYYFRKYQGAKNRNDLFACVFFLICAIMGFYGAGMVVFLFTFWFCMLKWRLFQVLRNFIILIFVFAVVYVLMNLISPDTLRYNKNIISLFLNTESRQTPRKLLSYSNYWKGYSSDPVDFIFGSGPGTFNSRSAFTIGSPDYFTAVQFLKSDSRPYYFQNFAYTLWNASNTVQYQEGFMNQPFSSLLAFLGEYGLLFTIVFLYCFYRQYKSVRGYVVGGHSLAFEMYKFTSIYLLILLVIDNYVEYPEVTILFITILKLAELRLSQNYYNSGYGE